MDRNKIKKALILGAGALSGKIALTFAGRKALDKATDKAAKILMEDIYDENIWEFVSNTTRIGMHNLIETKLRSSEGKTLYRPIGSPKRFAGFEELMFSVAQLFTMPTPMEEMVDTSVTIGKKAARPFTISLPVMIAPMAYGEALGENVKTALAKGAALAGTSNNTGEGPYLLSERKEAKYLIYQYHRGDWGKTPKIIRQCDAVEIQFSQGGFRGAGHIIKSNKLDNELREVYGYPKGKDVVIPSQQPEVKQPEDLKNLVNRLREESEGAPIGVKLAAGKFLEADLEIVCQSGIDFISLDGAEAGIRASSPILQDDFGVPLIFAIRRAAVWLEKNNYKDSVSLIASGRIKTPGDVLKACAMGADAVYIGVIALLAMADTQILKSLPFEPPVQLLWYDGKQNSKFNVNDGSKSLYNFLEASKGEIIEGLRALGKTGIGDVSTSDLVTTSQLISKGLGIPMVYEPFVKR